VKKTAKVYRELLEEYRVGLGFLSGFQTLYLTTSPKAVAAAKNVADLEQELAKYNTSLNPSNTSE
jgi:hypothetical protein